MQTSKTTDYFKFIQNLREKLSNFCYNFIHLEYENAFRKFITVLTGILDFLPEKEVKIKIKKFGLIIQ